MADPAFPGAFCHTEIGCATGISRIVPETTLFTKCDWQALKKRVYRHLSLFRLLHGWCVNAQAKEVGECREQAHNDRKDGDPVGVTVFALFLGPLFVAFLNLQRDDVSVKTTHKIFDLFKASINLNFKPVHTVVQGVLHPLNASSRRLSHCLRLSNFNAQFGMGGWGRGHRELPVERD